MKRNSRNVRLLVLFPLLYAQLLASASDHAAVRALTPTQVGGLLGERVELWRAKRLW